MHLLHLLQSLYLLVLYNWKKFKVFESVTSTENHCVHDNLLNLTFLYLKIQAGPCL